MSFSLSGSVITQSGTDTSLSGLSAIAGVTTSTEGKVTRYNIGVLTLSVTGTLTVCGSGVFEQLAWLGDANNDVTDISVSASGVLTIGVLQANPKDYLYNYGYPALVELRDSASDSSGQDNSGAKAALYVSSSATCNVYGQVITLRGGLGGKLSLYGSFVYCSTYYPTGTYSIQSTRVECHAASTPGMYLLSSTGTFVGLDRAGGASYIGLSGASPVGTYSIRDVPALPTGMPIMSAGLTVAGGVFEFRNSLLGSGYVYTTSAGRYYEARQIKEMSFDLTTTVGASVEGAAVWVKGAVGMTPVTSTTDAAGASGTMSVRIATATATNGTLSYSYNSATGDSTDDYEYRIRSFNHLFVSGTIIAKGNGVLATGATAVLDTRVTAASKAAAQAVLGIGWSGGDLSITADATSAQMWDWVKAWLCDNPAEDEGDYLGAALDFSALNIDIAAGVTVTGSLTTGGLVTLGSGATISGVYTDATGTSASLVLAGLQDASVLLVDGSGTTIEFQAAQSGEFDYVYNFAPGATGTWRWVAKAPGREHATGTFTPGAGGAFSYAPVLTQKLTPSGDPMYTGTTSALVSVSIPGTTNAYIDIGDGTAPLQESFNETELALVTQAGLEWLAAGKDDVSVFDSGSGDYLFLTAGWRLRRASAGDANAAIEAYVTSADGVIVDDTNGPVLYLTSNTPATIAAAVWAYIDRELTQAIPTAAQIADTMLGRNLAGGSDGGRTVRDALRASRNKSAISGSTLTVYQEDDATPAWTAAVSTAERDALQSIDPA